MPPKTKLAARLMHEARRARKRRHRAPRRPMQPRPRQSEAPLGCAFCTARSPRVVVVAPVQRACTQRLNVRQTHEAGRLSERTTPSCECFQVISVKTGRAEAATKHGERVGMEESAPLPSRAAGLALPELSSPCPLCSPPTRCELSPMAVAVPPVLVNTPPNKKALLHCPS